ncbi:MAG: TonB-dependent receptor, partial [Caulobacteraceae bacterium]
DGQAPSASPPSGNTVDEVVVSGHFLSQGSVSATKLDIPVRDTPYSVEAYTGDFLKAIGTDQVSDLYRYMTGLQRAGETAYDMTLRGFTTSSNDRNAIMTDGLPGMTVRFGSPPTVGTDHIEVVKGPASLLYGQSEPGGFVNIITKTPQDVASTVVSVRGTDGLNSVGHIGGYDVSVDSTGPIVADKLLYRLIAEYNDDDGYQDHSFDRAIYLAPSLTWRVDDATSATLQVEYRSTKTNYMNTQLIVPLAATNLNQIAPLTTNYTNPGGYQTESGFTETLRVKHRFSDWLTWNFAFRDVEHQDTAHAFDITGIDATNPGQLDLRARGQINDRSYRFGDTNFTATFNTFGIQHKAIFGLNLGQEIDDFNRTQYCALNTLSSTKVDPSCNIGKNVYTISLSDPSFAGIPSLSSFGPGKIGTGGSSRNHTYTTDIAEGAYASDYVTLTEHWKLSFGIRWAEEQQSNNADLLEDISPSKSTDTAVLPQGGIIYQPNRQLSFYVSDSTSFVPVPASTRGLISQGTFKPTTGNGVEGGIKTNLLENRVDFTTAVFSIDQHNILTPFSGNDPTQCPTGTTCQIQVGAARSTGAELELSARPLDGWTLLAGYAYTDARVTASTANGPLVGGPLPNSPRNAGHLWSRYDFSSGLLQGFGVGVGYAYIGDRKPFTPTLASPRAVTLPAYQVVDLGFYYKLPHRTELTFKISNLFDKVYYESGGTQNNYINIQPGAPRTAMLTVRTAF